MKTIPNKIYLAFALFAVRLLCILAGDESRPTANSALTAVCRWPTHRGFMAGRIY